MVAGQMGDMSVGDIAQNIYNLSSDQAVKMLAEMLQAVSDRTGVLERAEAQHSDERQAMTRLITMLASESRTVSEVQDLLERQLEADRAERDERRRFLDLVLLTLLALSSLNLAFHIYHRVLRRSGAAKP